MFVPFTNTNEVVSGNVNSPEIIDMATNFNPWDIGLARNRYTCDGLEVERLEVKHNETLLHCSFFVENEQILGIAGAKLSRKHFWQLKPFLLCSFSILWQWATSKRPSIFQNERSSLQVG